jgi:hypothetical protein
MPAPLWGRHSRLPALRPSVPQQVVEQRGHPRIHYGADHGNPDFSQLAAAEMPPSNWHALAAMRQG